MKKRSVWMRLGILAVAVTLATTSLTSGTLAKYYKQLNDVNASTFVAKFSPTLSGKYKSGSGSTEADYSDFGNGTFNLAKTITSTKSETGKREDLKQGSDTYNTVIAPGTDGEIRFDLNPNSAGTALRFVVTLEVADNASTDAVDAINHLVWKIQGEDGWFRLKGGSYSPQNGWSAPNGSGPLEIGEFYYNPNKDETSQKFGDFPSDSSGPVAIQKTLKWSWPYSMAEMVTFTNADNAAAVTTKYSDIKESSYDADDATAGQAAGSTQINLVIKCFVEQMSEQEWYDHTHPVTPGSGD